VTSAGPAPATPDGEPGRRWQQLAGALVALARETTVDARRQRAVRVAVETVQARAAALLVRGPDGSSERVVLSAADPGSADLLRRRLAGHQWGAGSGPSRGGPGEVPDLLEVVVPAGGGRASGHLYVLGPRRPGGFDAHDRALLTALAEATAVAVTGAALLEETRSDLQAQRQHARLVAAQQDDVIQRLFSIGLSVHSTSASVPGAPGDRLQQAVADIDETIRRVRATLDGSAAGG